MVSTKERILHEALELFSSSGYEAVSMRDIGAAVGIRESSIYKHYAGKKAILDAIVEREIEEINRIHEELAVPDPNRSESVSRYADMSIEDVAALITKVQLRHRKSETVSRFRQFLTIEQYRNEELRKLYREMFIERQLRYNEKVFSFLLEKGVLWGESAKLMAMQLFSPLFMLQYRFEDEEERLEEEAQAYIISFLQEHRKQSGAGLPGKEE